MLDIDCILISPVNTAHTRITVSNLPPEILCKIFFHLICQPDLLEDWLSVFHVRAHILQVCSRWRQIVRSYKLLWTYIPAFNLGWTRLALQLSAPLSIDVVIASEDVDAPTYTCSQTLNVLSPAISRTRSLIIHADYDEEIEREGSDTALYSALRAISTLETPLLETIYAKELNFCPGFCEIFFDLFKTSRPKLSHLTVNYCLFTDSLAEIRCESLTELRLIHSDICALPDAMLNFLSTLPSLVILVLDSAFEWESAETELELEPSVPKRSVQLPRLEHFYFEQDLFHASYLLPSLRIPLRATAELTVQGYENTDPSEQPGPIFELLRTCFGPSTRNDAIFREMRIYSSRGLCVVADQDFDENSLKCGTEDLPSVMDNAEHGILLSSSPHAVQVGVTKDFIRDSRHLPSSEFLRLLFESSLVPLEHVEVLQIASDIWEPFSRAILSSENADNSSPFPALRELQVSGLTGKEQSSHDTICGAVRLLALWSGLRLLKLDPGGKPWELSLIDRLREVVDVRVGDGALFNRIPASSNPPEWEEAGNAMVAYKD